MGQGVRLAVQGKGILAARPQKGVRLSSKDKGVLAPLGRKGRCFSIVKQWKNDFK